MNEAARFKKELLSREYGSNVVKIVESIKVNPSKEERTSKAKLLIKLIEKMNPSVRYAENSEEILWGHLYILSDMELDVDIDFKKPTVEVKKPERVVYPSIKPRYKHYGRNVEILGNKLAEITDEEDKKEAAVSYGKLLKTLYSSWNTNSVGDKLIIKNIEDFTNKNLTYDASTIDEEGKNSPFYTYRRPSANKPHQKSTGGKNYSNKNNNNRNKSNYKPR